MMIDRQHFFEQPDKNGLRTYNNIQKFTTGQRDYYTTCCLLDHPYFNEHNEVTGIDLSKQKVVDANPKTMQ